MAAESVIVPHMLREANTCARVLSPSTPFCRTGTGRGASQPGTPGGRSVLRSLAVASGQRALG